LVWVLFAASFASILFSIVLYWPTERLEQVLHLPPVGGQGLQVVGVVAGLIGIEIGMLFLAFA
jgi:hypothetical protein